ncbi:hypothetical protein GCM10028797_20720 [Dyella agri]
MQQFIPFEDDWDMLDAIRPEALIPYRVGLAVSPSGIRAAAQSTAPSFPSIASVSPSRTPMRLTVPADSSST